MSSHDAKPEDRRYTLDDLLYLMARLRDPQYGCPWDVEQTMQSILPSTIEEAYELADAIQQGDASQIKEELGDVLFQVIFHSQLGKELNWFDFPAVVHVLADKLVRRHPHVFAHGDLYAPVDEKPDVATIKQQWEAIKAEERKGKKQHGLLDDVPQALPALKRAQKLQKRVSGVGFDWPDALSAISKIREELDELEQAIRQQDADNIHEEAGDVLFSCVNVARHLKVDAEQALSDANRKFERRFRSVEQQLAQQGKTPAQSSLMEMDQLWEQAKQQLKK